MKETKNLEKRQRETRQRASCRLEDGEEVKDERRRRRRRRKTPRAEMERSSVSCRTNYRNIQEPGSAESISIRSLALFLWLSQSFSSPPLLQPLSLFFLFFHFPFYLTIPVGLLLVRYFLQYVFLQCANAFFQQAGSSEAAPTH